MPGEPAVVRRRLRVTGTVQGVGFRPFVYRHARSLGLAGYVLNDRTGVLIEVEGDPAAVAELCRLVSADPPPLARVEAVTPVELSALGEAGEFSILESEGSGEAEAPVSVDSATCADCLAEVFDPGDRRFRYPFTNCTNCGPRYTIVTGVPYDRAATTMAGFEMCSACRAEYGDPADRRFHAQPNACAACGPALAWRDASGAVRAVGDDAMVAAVGELRAGRIVALKGIGGYHLAVDATDEAAVAELRRRKARDDKPFAIMVADAPKAGELCLLDAVATAVLDSPRRPIVLAPRRPGAPVAAAVAPGAVELGVMIAYTPLHHLLLEGADRPLVMTSGNLSDDPIVHRDDEAIELLAGLVDGFLTHDRPINIRCDDSVVRAAPGRASMVRRSRGYSPEPLLLPRSAARQVLAVGAELKSTVSVVKGSSLVTSHHIGDLEHLGSYRSFLQATGHMARLFGVVPEVVAHDLHPEYLSTKWALDQEVGTLAVQHHHAHIASLLAEHGHLGRVLGVAFDGLGLGTDGSLWGGEFLAADLSGFERLAHLSPVALPGGPAAVTEPWRMALSWVDAAGGRELAEQMGPGLDDRWRGVLEIVAAGHAPVTTSAGRLFDAVAALLGVRSRVTYEGQAAVELEALATRAPRDVLPELTVEIIEAAPGAGAGEAAPGGRGGIVLDARPLVMGVVAARAGGTEQATIARAFHVALGTGTARLAERLASAGGLDTVALSGGVFQNQLLTGVVASQLRRAGLRVLLHGLVPPNDGGISVGQAAVAALG